MWQTGRPARLPFGSICKITELQSQYFQDQILETCYQPFSFLEKLERRSIACHIQPEIFPRKTLLRNTEKIHRRGDKQQEEEFWTGEECCRDTHCLPSVAGFKTCLSKYILTSRSRSSSWGRSKFTISSIRSLIAQSNCSGWLLAKTSINLEYETRRKIEKHRKTH